MWPAKVSGVLQSSGRTSNRDGAVLFRVSDCRGRVKAPDNKGLSSAICFLHISEGAKDPFEPAHQGYQKGRGGKGGRETAEASHLS